MTPRLWMVVAALLGAAAVTLGAFHAHGLEDFLTENRGLESDDLSQSMDNAATASRYLVVHALLLALVAHRAASTSNPSCWLQVSALFLVLGMAGFSGGLCLMVFTGHSIHWSIVPAGGLFLILGWLSLCGVPMKGKAGS